MKPGRKAGPRTKPARPLTAYEQRTVATARANDLKRWEHLFSLNAWKPSPHEPRV